MHLVCLLHKCHHSDMDLICTNPLRIVMLQRRQITSSKTLTAMGAGSLMSHLMKLTRLAFLVSSFVWQPLMKKEHAPFVTLRTKAPSTKWMRPMVHLIATAMMRVMMKVKVKENMKVRVRMTMMVTVMEQVRVEVEMRIKMIVKVMVMVTVMVKETKQEK